MPVFALCRERRCRMKLSKSCWEGKKNLDRISRNRSLIRMNRRAIQQVRSLSMKSWQSREMEEWWNISNYIIRLLLPSRWMDGCTRMWRGRRQKPCQRWICLLADMQFYWTRRMCCPSLSKRCWFLSRSFRLWMTKELSCNCGMLPEAR